MSKHVNKVTGAGLLIALGIIYGDIGTSPLYVFNSIINGRLVDESLILGSLSCIIWTLTLITTVKYVMLILRADNNGEGGTFSLFALVRRRKKWLVIPAMIGGAALLADGIITPPISITAAIEGLKNIPSLHDISVNTIMYIVIGILIVFFLMQQFGTGSIGKLFGPVMFIWFTMIAILGISHLADDLSIIRAFNPYYAVKFLASHPGAFGLLGAVFLCTTGAEALYSDLGHCGKSNIRITWVYVKICLVLNYLGQGAYILHKYKGVEITKAFKESTNLNTFYDIMPPWFVLIGVIVAASAAIIASQAMIAGSFTLIGEALRLNIWPKMKVNFPSEAKGQLFIPGLNTLMFVGCLAVVLYFKESSKMEAAYGLAIIITMIATTILFANYLVLHRVKSIFIYCCILHNVLSLLYLKTIRTRCH